MLKQTVSFTDFNDRPQTEDLYFNISKAEILSNLDLEDQFRDVLALFDTPHDWSREEVTKYLHLIKHVMRLSYGVRSEDGKRFRKSPEIWDDFQSSAAYDAYLFSLFEVPEKANLFLTGVLPADLREEARKEVERQGGVINVESEPATDQPSEPTDEELLLMHPMDMSEAQKARAFELRFGRK